MGMRFMSLTLKYSEPIIYLIFMLNYLWLQHWLWKQPEKILQVACKANFEVSCTKLMQWSYGILM